MKVIYFNKVKYIVESEEHDRHGMTVMCICSEPPRSEYLVATKDINEGYWLLSNGLMFEEVDVWIKEED
jgi:hypothetical protein